MYIPSVIFYNTAKKIDKHNSIDLISNYFLEHIDIFLEVMRFVCDNYQQNLYKYANTDGYIYHFSKVLSNGDLEYVLDDKKIVIAKNNILNETINYIQEVSECLTQNHIKNPTGIICDSKIYLLLTIVTEVYIHKNNDNHIDIYHFSGTQMINYLCKNNSMSKENIEFLNNALKNIPCKLPNVINFHLISTDFLKYISCLNQDNSHLLDDIINKYIEIEQMKKEKETNISNIINSKFNELALLSENELEIILNNNLKKKSFKIDKLRRENHNKLISELSNELSKEELSKNTSILNLNNKIDEKIEQLTRLIKKYQFLFDDFSQYDMLFHYLEIYISPLFDNYTIKEINKFNRFIEKNIKN